MVKRSIQHRILSLHRPRLSASYRFRLPSPSPNMEPTHRPAPFPGPLVYNNPAPSGVVVAQITDALCQMQPISDAYDDYKDDDKLLMVRGVYTVKVNRDAAQSQWVGGSCPSSPGNFVAGQFHTACFAPDTRVSLAGGEYKTISDLKPGDRLMNPLTGRNSTIAGLIYSPGRPRSMYEVSLGGDTAVKVTASHAFPTASGFKQATELTRSDRLFDGWGHLRKIKSIRRLREDELVNTINLVFQEASTDLVHEVLVGGGIISGNATAQTRLRQETKKTVLAATVK